MAAGNYEDIYGGARRKDRRRNIFSLGSKSTNRATSTQLRRPAVLNMKPHCNFNVSFKSDDKLIIVFSYQKKFVVYKKSNSTVAILENVTFRRRDPPVMFDGDDWGAVLHKLELKLMYAVAKKDFRESNGILFHENDVVLILAHCRDIFLGITKGNRVGFFPAETVNIITNPKPCFFEGMTLTVTGVVNFMGEDKKELSVYEKQDYEITKGRCGLFDWFASNHLHVPLHAVSESGMTLSASALKEEHVYFDLERENIFYNVQRNDHKPVGKCAERRANMCIGRDKGGYPPYLLQKQDTTMPIYPPPPLSLDPPPLPPRNAAIECSKDLHQASGGTCVGDRTEENSIGSEKKSAEEDPYEIQYLSDWTKLENEDEIQDFNVCEVYSPCDCQEKVVATLEGLGVVDHLEKQEEDRNNTTEVTLENFLNFSQSSSDDPDDYSAECSKPDDEKSYFSVKRSANDEGLYDGFAWSERMKKNSFDNSDEDPTDYEDPTYYEADDGSNFSDTRSPNDEDRSERMTKKPTEDLPPVPAPRRQSLASPTKSDSQTGIESSALFTTIPDDDEELFAVCRQSEDVKKRQKEIKEREDLLQKLLPYREVVINDELKRIVAACVDPDVLSDLCKQIKVPQNRLRDIHNQQESIYAKTYDLLEIWQGKFETTANVGFLIDALVEANPEDLNIILYDMSKYFENPNVRDPGLYEILDEDNIYALPKKAKDRKTKDFLHDLRDFKEVKFNDEMRHIVSLYLDDKVWHDFGERLEISTNTRIKIETTKDDIYGKTSDLLGQWHQKFGSDATLGFLLEALGLSKPADLYLILKDLLKSMETLVYEDVQ